jgi:hypothetical protein
MVTVGENNKILNESLMMSHILYHSTLEGAQLQDLQQNTDNIKLDGKLRVTQVDNNILKIQLHKMKQKLKLQEEWHSAVALLMQIQ